MKLPRNLSFIEHLNGRDSGTNGSWDTLLVRVEKESPEGLHSLTPRKKYILKRFECTTSAQAERLWSRLRFIRGISHPNIVAYHGSVLCRDVSGVSILVVCDVCLRGSLLDLMSSKRAMCEKSGRNFQLLVPEKFSLHVFMDICEGLVYLHETMQAVHGNIRPSNVLIDTDGICRLTDVGLRISGVLASEASSDPLTSLCLTSTVSEYSPPECYACDLRCSRTLCSASGDMFALGCLLTELITGTYIHERSKKFGIDPERLSHVLDEIASLVSSNSAAWVMSSALLQKSPSARPTAPKALYLLNRKTGRSISGTNNSTNSIPIEPFIVPRAKVPDEQKNSENITESKEDDDILSFFHRVWGDEPSEHGQQSSSKSDASRRATAIPSQQTAISPKGTRKGHRSANTRNGTEESQQEGYPSILPKSVLRAQNAISSNDEESINRRKAHSLRLCADALELQRMEKIEAAEYKFKTAIAASPVHTPIQVLYEYGNFLFSKRQDIRGAETMWQRSSEQDPKHVPSLYALAKLKANFRDDVQTAEELMNRIISLEPRHADALRSYGILLAGRGQDRLSEAALKNSLKADLHNVETLVAYGWLLHKVGRIEEAEDHYLRALSRDEQNHKATSLLALLHQDRSPPPWPEVNLSHFPHSSIHDTYFGNKKVSEKTPYCTPRALESRSLASLYLQARKPTLHKVRVGEDENEGNTAGNLSSSSRSERSRSTNSNEALAVSLAHLLDPELPKNMLLHCEDASHFSSVEFSCRDRLQNEPPTPPLEDEDSADCAAIFDVNIIKHRTAGSGQHTEYCLECRCMGHVWQVWRRFSDFHNLQSQVHALHSGGQGVFDRDVMILSSTALNQFHL
jgi:serine/threonine protein kinase